ncbi:MAG: GIY-YIG nuclease family protein [Gallionellaceae bacterium]|jgi:hypothetical protein
MATFQKRGETWRVIVRLKGVCKSATFETKSAATAWAGNLESEIRKRYEIDQERPYRVPKGLTSERSIMASAVPVESMSGVYFLILHERIIYIGKSVDVYNRISNHRSNGRIFTHYSIIQCPPEGLNELESKYILAFNPVGNKGRYGKLIYSVTDETINRYINEVNKSPTDNS